MRHLQSVLTSLALAILLIGPLIFPFPYGANRPAGAVRLQVIAFAALALAVLGMRARVNLRSAWVPVTLSILMILLGIVQVVPLPAGVIESISPRSAQVWDDASTVLVLFGRDALSPRISIVPWETIQQVLLIVAWLSLFATALIISHERPRAPRWIVLALAFTGAIHALHATVLIRFPSQFDQFGGRAHGTFINPNHLAAYLNICLAAAFALLLIETLYALMGHRPSRITQAQSLVRFFLAGTLVLVTGAGILLSQSRGGIASAVLMLLFMTTATMFHPRVRTKRRTIVAGLLLAMVVVAAGSVVLSSPAALYRFLSIDPRDAESNSRTEYVAASIDAWRQYPIAGSGLGTFRESFREIQPVEEASGYISHAHNDPVELLVTGGVVGFAIGVAGFIAVMVMLLRAWWRERHREQSVWILAGAAALLAVSVHSLVEFPYTIPAIPAALAVLLGASWRAAETSSVSSRAGGWAGMRGISSGGTT